jgi:pyridoxal/pyridoxine/pyridoxamine kinase
LHLLAVSRQHTVHTYHPRVEYRVHGTGDALSAAWLGLYLRTGDMHASLTQAAQFVYRAVHATAQAGQRELHLLAVLPWLQRTAMRLAQEAGKPWEDGEEARHDV